MNGVREFVDINLVPSETISKQSGEVGDDSTPIPQGSSEISGSYLMIYSHISTIAAQILNDPIFYAITAF